jgi:putative MATE family efflux protein
LIWFGGSEQTIPYAEEYLYITVPGNILAGLSFSYNAVMRASGYPRKAMITMLIGAFTNVILDPIFIFGLNMGIRGAAIATVISMALSAAFVMHHFIQKDSIVRFHRKYFTLKPKIVIAIVSIGMSPFAMQLAGSMVNVMMINALKNYGGDYAVGANGIITSFAMLLVMFILGLSQGMQPIIGFNYGAGNIHRVMETLWLVIRIATVATGVGFICSWFFPDLLVRAFTNDPLMLSISANALRLSLMAFLVVGSQVVIGQFFQSIGIAWKSMVQSLSRQCLFLIPAILILPDYFGLDGVWLAAPLSDLLAAVTAWMFLWHQIKKFKKQALL